MEKFVILNLLDGIYETKLTKKFEARKRYKKESKGIIKAYIPGVIKKIYVKKGDEVKKDMPIIVLEAMKMQNEIFSPISGKVEEVLINENEKV